MLTFMQCAPHKYGRLVLVRRSPSRVNKGIFRCTCGTEKEIAFCAVYQGKTRSCGCLQREYLVELGRSHRENYRAFKAQFIPSGDGEHLNKEERCRAFNFKAAFKAPVQSTAMLDLEMLPLGAGVRLLLQAFLQQVVFLVTNRGRDGEWCWVLRQTPTRLPMITRASSGR